MAATFNKKLLSGYLTLELNQAVETGLQNAQTSTNPPPLEVHHDADPPPPEKSEWVVSIKEKLEQARADDVADAWAKHSIYRIPHYLRDTDGKAYIPQTVSLGPYHHGRRRLRAMDRHKWRALHHVLMRTGHGVELYLDDVRKVEKKARACYEGPICLSSNDFVEMLVLDATFALELLRGADADAGFTELGYSPSDPIFAFRGAMICIQHDMIMLENQIPLFVLDCLHAIQCGGGGDGGVNRLAHKFLYGLIPRDKLPDGTAFPPLPYHRGVHCLEVFRRSLTPRGVKPSHEATRCQQQLQHCATELKDAGIKFKRMKTHRFWDIDFTNGVLSMPRLLVQDNTKSVFLNLVAFEQCHVECTNDITSYVVFMDILIDSPADVSYLRDCEIIDNWLGSDAEVANLFNGLGKGVTFNIRDSSLSPLMEEMNAYYNRRWNKWRASLMHKYFNNPWSIISFVAAVVLLLLTSAQTFYAVYAYYVKPPSS